MKFNTVLGVCFFAVVAVLFLFGTYDHLKASENTTFEILAADRTRYNDVYQVISVIRDKKTGCEYITYGGHLYPRVNKNGTHICTD